MSSAPLTLPAHATMFTGGFPAAARRTRQRRLLSRSRGQRPWLSGSPPAATAPAPSSGLTCSTRSGGSIRDSRHYADDFDLSKVKALSLGNVPGGLTPWSTWPCHGFETVAGSAVLRLVALLRCARALRRRRSRSGRAIPGSHTTAKSPSPTRSSGAWSSSSSNATCSNSTIVVVLGDHGESLGEHDEGTHGFFIYETATHVPFLVRAPFEPHDAAAGSPSLVRTRGFDADDARPARAGGGQSRYRARDAAWCR